MSAWSFRMNRTAIAWLALAAVTIGGGASALFLALGSDEADDLRRGLEAREEAGRNLEDIIDSLEEIASDLESASGLPGQSRRISELTEAQRRSIQALAAVLDDQLRALEETRREVDEAGASAAQIAELSAEEAERLRENVRGLRRIRELAASAGATSAELARLTAYGARLAREARDAFTGS